MRRRILEQVMPAAMISAPVFVAVALLLSLTLENVGAPQMVAAICAYGTLAIPGVAIIITDALLRWWQHKGRNLVVFARNDSSFREFTQKCSLTAYATSFASAAILFAVWPNLFLP